MLAEGDPEKEKQLRKMDYYSFLQRILVLNKRVKAQNQLDTNGDPFGSK